MLPDQSSGVTDFEYRVTYVEHDRLVHETAGLSGVTANQIAENALKRGAGDVQVWRRPRSPKWEKFAAAW